MEDGYYWYFSGDGDEGDLQTDDPQIIYIQNSVNFRNPSTSIEVMGGDYPYKLEDAHGTFKGPLAPPES